MAKKKIKVTSYLPLFIGAFAGLAVFTLIANFAFGFVKQPEYQLSNIPVATGIFGKATLSPTCSGPRRSVEVCSKAFKGDFKAINTQNNETTKFSTEEDGSYKVRLSVGTYKIYLDTTSKSRYPRLSNPVVEVKSNRLVEQPLILDSGIR